MKAKTRILLTTVVMSGIVPAAFAATGGREDNSSLVVWTFLGFCALIIVAQLYPAIRSARLAARLEKERRAAENAVKMPAEK